MRSLFLAVSAIVFFQVSCTKISSTEIGRGLIPPVDNVNTFDTTIDVITSTHLNPIVPVVFKGDDFVVGVLNDPTFGRTEAATFLELKPTIYPYSFPFNPAYRVADSAVLILKVYGIYGDSTVASPIQNWEVREMAELLEGDTVYNTNINPAVGAMLGTANVNVKRLSDSVINRFEATNWQVRIKLNQAFAQRLINTYDSTNAYRSDSLFREAFKGFAVMPAPGSNGNALVRVSLSDVDTRLALYYHKDSANIKSDTSVNYFRVSRFITQESALANRVMRYYNGTELAAVLGDANAASAYVHTAPGTFVEVAIPGLENLSNRIIHRAELIAHQEDADSDPLGGKLAPPRSLLLARYDSATNKMANVPHDFQIEQQGINLQSFGGFLMYKNVTGFNNRVASYHFNISRYIQGIVTRGEKAHTLRIYAPVNDTLQYTLPYPNHNSTTTFYLTPASANRLAEGRIKLAGGSNGNDRIKMRVRIIYSRL